ncbi:chitinase [Purpureocillium lavendulum]|uniref:Chitinase n=1 Tax=Purpureocillium lavendulum TaxID=1247861 RepID=A0AB34FEK5_9HYPO|nr:chitinase [Purpureocillium lavendulum]
MTNHQAVVYWGQHGGNTRENSDLAAYCKPDSGIDIVVLAFLFTYGNGLTTPSGTIGQSCTITSEGQAQGCDGLAAAIDHCKSRGVKVLLSLGGAVGAYSLRSQEEAEAIGQRLWDAYGNTDSKNVSRPFGKTFVDGWDFDLENSDGSQYYGHLIAKLRSNFVSDPGGRYLVTGAPQCPVPEPNMHAAIKQAKFDYLFVQFYNNPTCSVDGHINYNEWKHYIANAPSADAKIFFGVPAAPLAATGSQSGARYYLQPAALASLIRAYKTDDAFGGVMLWSAAHSDGNVIGGKTYAQHVKNMLGLG